MGMFFDENGSMITRTMGTETFQFGYDALNRLTEVEEDDLEANFIYNGDGERILGVISATNVITTVYIGSYFEFVISDTQTITKSYYYAGATRVAMRENGTLYFLLSDHLGSTSLTVNSSGERVAELRYKPWGLTRYTYGSQKTSYQFTGQKNDGDFVLYFYQARFYAPSLGRFISPDTLIPNPNNNLEWDRYQYVRSNPLRYTDPTGFCSGDPNDPNNPDISCWKMLQKIEETYENINIKDQDKWTWLELQALWSALAGHVFKKEILNAPLINFYRKSIYINEKTGLINRGVGGETRSEFIGYSIYIFDYAFRLPPDMNSAKQNKSFNNFQGVIVHELTHVAIFENPNILTSYSNTANMLKHPKVWLPKGIGKAYPTDLCDPNCDSEWIAIAASTWQLSPESFDVSASYTDWRKNWIESFYSTNTLLGDYYAPSCPSPR
jgi:RHS repeat-associated protein